MNYRVLVVTSVLLFLTVGVYFSDNLGVAAEPEMREKSQDLKRSITKETIREKLQDLERPVTEETIEETMREILQDLEGPITKEIMKEILLGIEKLITKETITEGRFKSLRIGQSKKAVISSLQDMGISHIFPNVLDVVTITESSDLQKIGDVDSTSIVLNEGVVWVKFDGNVVQKIKAPPHSELKRRFSSLKTRDEVFSVYADILSKDQTAYVRNLGFDARWVTLGDITDGDMQLLRKYDSWKTNFNDSDGYWHFQLKFSNNLLKEIITTNSPVELP